MATDFSLPENDQETRESALDFIQRVRGYCIREQACTREMENKVVFHSTLRLKLLLNPGHLVLNVVQLFTASPQRANASPGPHFPRFVGKRAFFCCLLRLAFRPGLFLGRQSTHPVLTEKAGDSAAVTDGSFCTGCEQNVALCLVLMPAPH